MTRPAVAEREPAPFVPWRRRPFLLTLTAAFLVATATAARAQGPDETAETRAGQIVAAQREKAANLRAYVPSKAEELLEEVEEHFRTGQMHWHPFFENAYAGGGFTLGAGYLRHVGPFNSIDVRGSYTIKSYKRIESEFRAPRLFGRRGTLSVIGGWREALEVGYYGLGMNTAEADRANYSFQQPYVSTTLEWRPQPRHWLVFVGGFEYSQWAQRSGHGSAPSVETVYTPDSLPGLGATLDYAHVQTAAGIDWRDAPDYSRRGGYYGVTWQKYWDSDDPHGFGQVDYELIQHVPLLRDTWVLSFRARAVTTYTSDGETIPFFMLPALGGGSTLRGYASWRFRDHHSLLLQAEWRTIVSNFVDVALFYDAGKVAARRSDLNLDGMRNDVGIGLRLHGPVATPVRIELAKGNEGVSLVFSAHATF